MSGKRRKGNKSFEDRLKRALIRAGTVFAFGITLAATLQQLNWWIISAIALASLVALLFERSRALQSRLMYLLPVAVALDLILVMCGVGAWHPLGVDKPIELKPLCEHLGTGGIVAPPTEKSAAFHYHCAGSDEPITRTQIEQRCKDQWGTNAKLVLRDPNSAAGWKCHVGGLITAG